MKRFRRTMLFMPGNNPGMLQNAGILGADSIILDLEDAVSLTEKDSARILVREAIKNLDCSRVEVVVRVNPLDTEFGALDVDMIARVKPDTLLIPKADEEEIKLVDIMLTKIEEEEGYLAGSIKIIALIETALGLETIYSVIKASKRIVGVLLGGEDLTADLGINRTKEGEEIFYARNKVATACRALKVDAIDTPFTDIDDSEGLAKDTAKAKSLGLTGKAVINPRQIEIIHSVLAPSEMELKHALRILAGMEEAKKEGKGVFSLDGKMIDAPVIHRATFTVEQGIRLGLVEDSTPPEGYEDPPTNRSWSLENCNCNRNLLGRELPDYIEGYGKVKPFKGELSYAGVKLRKAVKLTCVPSGNTKVLENLDGALDKLNIIDGLTISFHHHLRNGDHVLNMVVEALAKRGVKNLTVAASSIFPIHAPLVEHIKNGVVTGLVTSYMSGPVAEAVSRGELKKPVRMQTHGGRSRAIESGDLQIDVAFIAAPTADTYGNINGVEGQSACGTLGYAVSDAEYADKTVVITDNLVPFPACPIEISQVFVDYVVEVDCIGDPKGIVSGTTKITTDPVSLIIANMAAEVIKASGLVKDGMSFQTGAGGTSLAVAAALKDTMKRGCVVGSFAAGGVTGYLVEMLKEGLFRTILDVQCFDLKAIDSYRNDARHQAMSASMYGNPHTKGAVVDTLDIMILGATEIDTEFNVNVTTNSKGVIMGGSGGHSDTAAGSKLAIVVTKLMKARLPIIKDKVTTITTPGDNVDVLVTERGIAVNPRRLDLIEILSKTKLPLMPIEELKILAEKMTGVPKALETSEKIVAVVEYRDGSVIDVVRMV